MSALCLRIYVILFLVFGSGALMAQMPQAIPYQAVARNSSGGVIASANITVRFSIRDSFASGSIKYRETHSVMTTAQGQFSINIGQGTSEIGSFSGINWAVNAKFLQVEIDPAGGSTFTDLGTQQMLSVPYALYAGTSTISTTGFVHYVGESFGGGVVFHVYKDASGVEHGLVVAKTDQSTGIGWSNITGTAVGSLAQSYWDGMTNSNAVVAQSGHSSSASNLGTLLVSGGFDDWYLPSIDELRLLFNSKFSVNAKLREIASAVEISPANYWSSTERNATLAWTISFNLGVIADNAKNSAYYARAIRKY